MKTSYFKKSGADPNIVAICVSVPSWVVVPRRYPKLSPPRWLLYHYKHKLVTEDQYREVYQREVLDKLDPAMVYADLGDDAILCCWESSKSPNFFCHRTLVAEWLNKSLGTNVSEIE
jgi:hypothetical protein